ncbi:MAG: hypothetical protein ABSA15_06595 [Thermoplasmata archaeon]|jgi:hypothetical protein
METEPYRLVAPDFTDSEGRALSLVAVFLESHHGSPASCGEFWNYLRDHHGFHCVSADGKRVVRSLETDSQGTRFARVILNHSVAKGVGRKLPDEDMWEL